MEKKHISDISILCIREFTLHIAILCVTSLGRYSLYVAVLLELVVRLVHKYDLGEKNVRCLLTHSCVLQLLQLLLFATTIYLPKMIDPSKKHAH